MPDYDSDFYGWANEQAALLRAGLFLSAGHRLTTLSAWDLAAGHNAMVTAPRETADLLMEIAL